MTTLEKALAEATKNKRVCPQPSKWNELYDLLPNKHRKGNGWEPALPLILAAWNDSPAMFKALRFGDHLEWAAKHNAIDQVYAFMVSLKEIEWYHYGE